MTLDKTVGGAMDGVRDIPNGASFTDGGFGPCGDQRASFKHCSSSVPGNSRW
jgi:hypothetical protein